MKRAMVYILALTVAFSALLAGCGEVRDDMKNPVTTPTTSPKVTLLPESMMPDPEDGVVKDNDGIITDNDTGVIHNGIENNTGTGAVTNNSDAANGAPTGTTPAGGIG